MERGFSHFFMGIGGVRAFLGECLFAAAPSCARGEAFRSRCSYAYQSEGRGDPNGSFLVGEEWCLTVRQVWGPLTCAQPTQGWFQELAPCLLLGLLACHRGSLRREGLVHCRKEISQALVSRGLFGIFPFIFRPSRLSVGMP